MGGCGEDFGFLGFVLLFHIISKFLHQINFPSVSHNIEGHLISVHKYIIE